LKAFAQNGYGAADAYELVDVAAPDPSADEVLVKVMATAVNDWEWGMLRAPWMVRLFIGLRRPRGKFHVMGCDIAGRVETVGRNVSSDVKTSFPAWAYLRALKPGGVYATVGGDRVFLFMLLAPLINLFTRKRLKAVMLKPNKNLAEISELVGSGALEPVIDHIFAFADLRQALTRFRDGKHEGKIVIRMP
jgi:NADPH:quinone reductase-like Zn-dependent oxidoreductase